MGMRVADERSLWAKVHLAEVEALEFVDRGLIRVRRDVLLFRLFF